MKLRFALLSALTLARAQSPPKGIVDVNGSITATAGTLQCVGVQTVGQKTSVLHMRCVDAGMPLLEADYGVPTAGAMTLSLSRAGNTVSWTLTHGTPDQWKIAANDAVRTGNF
jgi:hypothetical protein